MKQQHPITPPPELLVQQWLGEYFGCDVKREVSIPELHLAARAAQWGADQELEACLDWLQDPCCADMLSLAKDLKYSRRWKPPSLKEQALIHFESFAATFETSGGDSDLIRRALEQLDD